VSPIDWILKNREWVFSAWRRDWVGLVAIVRALVHWLRQRRLAQASQLPGQEPPMVIDAPPPPPVHVLPATNVMDPVQSSRRLNRHPSCSSPKSQITIKESK